MLRRLVGVMLMAAAVLGLGWSLAHAGSTFAGLPAASQPLGNVPTYVPMDQGSGCAANTTPCSTVQSDALRLGQPIQATCASILSPWQYQMCIDTSLNPTALKEYIGSTWFTLYVLNSSIGPFGSMIVGSTTVGGSGATNGYALFNNNGVLGNATIPTLLGYTPLNPANNLSDVASASTSRTNLGLGSTSDVIFAEMVLGNYSLIDENAVLAMTKSYPDPTATGSVDVPAAINISVQTHGDNTNVHGGSGLYENTVDDATVTSANKGVLYSLSVGVAPSVARNNPPYDDATAVLIDNRGTAKGTSALYFGQTTPLADLNPAWGTLIEIQANAVSAIFFDPGVTFTYGIDYQFAGSGVTAAMRLANSQPILFRNAANSADLIAFTSDPSNSVYVGGGNSTMKIDVSGNEFLFGTLTMEGSVSYGIDFNAGSYAIPIRLPNAKAIGFRNGANSADLDMITTDSSNTVYVGGGSPAVQVDTGGNLYAFAGVQIGGPSGGIEGTGTINVGRGIYANGVAGVTGSACTAWTFGICTSP